MKPTRHGKKWRIRPVDENGKRLSLTFDTFKEAKEQLHFYECQRAEAIQTQAPNAGPSVDSIEEIKELLGAPKYPDKTFRELCDMWPERNRAIRKRTARDDQSIIRAHLLPAFGNLLIRNISIEKINQFKGARDHLSPKTLNNHITLLISMLRYAAELGWGIGKCPRIKKPKIVLVDKDFRYLKSEKEVADFLISAKQEPHEMPYYLFATAIYTGLRQGEIAALTRSDIDFRKNLITVSKSFDGPTKNGETRHVPIPVILRPLLKQWILLNPTKTVFTNAYGNPLKPNQRVFQEVLHGVLDRAGFPKTRLKNGKVKRYIVFHDLRHTFASHWVMNGGDIYKLNKILGHKSLEMTMRYAHLAPAAFEKEADIFGDALAGFDDGRVLQMPTMAHSSP